MTSQILSPVPDSFAHFQSRAGQCQTDIAADLSPGLPDFSRASNLCGAFVKGPTVFDGDESAALKSQIHHLSPNGVLEIEAALRHFQDLELDGDEVSRERFPLPTLTKVLDQCAVELHQGRGVCIIRGLTPQHYSPEENVILFLAIASYIGTQRGVQNAKGDMLSHVFESKAWTVPREKRHGIHTNGSLPYHNDMGCDILSMHVRECAAVGGATFVASSGAIYNDLMQTNPRALGTLAAADWPIQVSRPGALPFVLSPLVKQHCGHLMMAADPSRIGPHPSAPKRRIPSLTSAQQEALGLLQQAADRNRMRLPVQAGDMVFLNNWAFLHSREAYQDHKTSERHIVRLWLRNEKHAWDIPDSMRAPWDDAFGPRSHKIVNRQYPVVPMPKYMQPKYGNGTAAFVAEESDGEEIEEGEE
ncbi:Clavaminate synthase-like protein [Xylariomycetidae sp. FL0641]|nr:Clavaminate synthase-like protein [Xylariomycetidae sp. FL0641]